MPLTIGNLTFDYLSGPTSCRLLTPTSNISLIFEKFIPPMILLGDEHTNNTSLCNPNNPKILNTFTPYWMRLIDSLGIKNMKVKYYIEGNVPLEVINSKYYINDEIRNWIYDIPKNNVMSYIPNFYPECFSEINDKCPIDNIEFYYSDLRAGLEFSNIERKDAKYLNNKKSKKIAEIFKLNKPSKFSHALKYSKARKDRIYIHSTDDYESILYRTIGSSLSLNRSLSAKNIARINDISILELLRLLLNDSMKFAKIIFDPSNKMLNSSKLLKSIMLFSSTCKNSEECAKFCIQLFYDYVIYIVHEDIEIRVLSDKLEEALDNYKKDTDKLNDILLREHLTRISLRSNKMPSRLNESDFEHKNKINEYKEVSESIARTVMMAFNDMYTLFHSWTKLTPLVIYNAGESHCKYLSDFLSTYYEVKTFTKHSKEILRWNLPYAHNNISRCLKFTKTDLNIDNEIFQNFINQYDLILSDKKILDDYKKQFELIKTRIDILGELYNQMLKGRLISSKEIETQCSKFGKIEDCKRICNLSTISYTVQTEYANKVSIN